VMQHMLLMCLELARAASGGDYGLKARTAPLGEYSLQDATRESGVQPIVSFLMAGEGYQKRGEAHFVVRRLRAVSVLADDDFAMAWDLRSESGDTLWRATCSARGLFDVPEATAYDTVHTSFNLPPPQPLGGLL